MANRTAPAGRMATLTVLAAVPEAAVPDLTGRLAALDPAASPFAAVPGTHFARLLMLPRDGVISQARPVGMRLPALLLDLLTHAGRRQRPDRPTRSHLLFTAAFDAPATSDDDTALTSYVEALRVGLADRADAIWGPCLDYPGWPRGPAFHAFFRAGRLTPRYVFTPTDDQAPVTQVRSALALRHHLITLALRPPTTPESLTQALQTLPRDHGNFRTRPPQAPQPPPRDHGNFRTQPSLAVPHRPAQNPRTEPDLSDIQGLVGSGYPTQNAARHRLLRIDDPGAAATWLTELADLIPTAQQARSRPERSVHIAVSHSGLRRLGVAEHDLAGFPSEFRAGMASREPALAPGQGTAGWQAPFTGRVDALLIVSAQSEAALQEWMTDPRLKPAGCAVVGEQSAARIPVGGLGGGFREHFGFVDGLSQPRIHGLSAPGPDELPAGEVLLGYRDVDGDTAGAGMAPELARNGSFLVYRRLRQDVAAFRELTGRMATELGGDEELAAAKLMGRWRDGSPLTLCPSEPDQARAGTDFGYQEHDAQGFNCPVGAHVRRVNPRDSRPLDTDLAARPRHKKGLERQLAQRHRMLRRGIPYRAGDECGLLFVALVGDIRRQFEFVQAHWMADGNAFRLGTDQDPFAGAAPTKLVVQGPEPAFVAPGRSPVTCTGGEYFLLPGLAALRNLASKPGVVR